MGERSNERRRDGSDANKYKMYLKGQKRGRRIPGPKPECNSAACDTTTPPPRHLRMRWRRVRRAPSSARSTSTACSGRTCSPRRAPTCTWPADDGRQRHRDGRRARRDPADLHNVSKAHGNRTFVVNDGTATAKVPDPQPLPDHARPGRQGHQGRGRPRARGERRDAHRGRDAQLCLHRRQDDAARRLRHPTSRLPRRPTRRR